MIVNPVNGAQIVTLYKKGLIRHFFFCGTLAVIKARSECNVFHYYSVFKKRHIMIRGLEEIKNISIRYMYSSQRQIVSII